jgi:hypothetical protein
MPTGLWPIRALSTGIDFGSPWVMGIYLKICKLYDDDDEFVIHD